MNAAAPLASLLLLAAGAAHGSQPTDAAGCAHWSALFRQVATDRDTGVPEALERQKLGAIIGADQRRPEPYLVRDADDEFYLWITVEEIYEHAWYTPSKIEAMITDECLARIERAKAPKSQG